MRKLTTKDKKKKALELEQKKKLKTLCILKTYYKT